MVGDFGKWLTKAPGLPSGSPAEVDQFVQQTHRGTPSDTKLHEQYGGGTIPHPPGAPGTVAAKQALIGEPHNVWSKTPSTVHVEFANRMGSGAHPNDVFRQLVAEIAEHHASGQINNRDAHRAANEAFGRLLMSRKKRTGARKQAWSGWGPANTKSRRHKVAGWEWDDYQNGFVTTAARDFECSCGAPVKVPDYHNCKCGKIWNTYIIGTGGDRHEASAEKFIAREIPARRDVVVAKRKVAMYESDECPTCGSAGHHDPDCEDRDVDLSLQKVPDRHRRGATDHFHDGEGRYTGPMKMKAPADPFEGADNCPECGNHFAHGHDAECPRISKWGNSQRGDLQSVPQKKQDSYSEELNDSASGEFPTKHSPKVDIRSKGVQNGKSTKDWRSRDHASQQFRN